MYLPIRSEKLKKDMGGLLAALPSSRTQTHTDVDAGTGGKSNKHGNQVVPGTSHLCGVSFLAELGWLCTVSSVWSPQFN